MPRRLVARAPAMLALACMLALGACGGDDDDASWRAGGADPDGVLAGDLPQPQDATGSVTGMPGQPGPGTVPLATTGSGSPATSGDDAAPAVATDAPVGADAAAPPPTPILVLPEPAPVGTPQIEAGTSATPPTAPTPESPARPRPDVVELDPGALPRATETTTLEVPADAQAGDGDPR